MTLLMGCFSLSFFILSGIGSGNRVGKGKWYMNARCSCKQR